MHWILIAAGMALSACATTAAEPEAKAGAETRDVLVIAHRGASGDRPEHTLAAYEEAIRQGAEFIEPDLVITKDGVLVARHENEISGTTDVAGRPEFADRRTTKRIDGEAVTGWFTEDFTLAELKTLRARERLPDLRSTDYDDRFEVPTFAEVIALAKREGVGIYPETKHPTYFRSIGLPLGEPLVAALDAVGWSGVKAPVFIQSFEVANLEYLAGLTNVRLIQLIGDPRDTRPVDDSGITAASMLTGAGLARIADYAWGIGANKALVHGSDLTERAHAAGLLVHAWTLRAENMFLPPKFQRGEAQRDHGNIAGEACALVARGVDGLFTDHVDDVADGMEAC